MSAPEEAARIAELERLVAQLSARQAIRDVLVRYCRGADRCDVDLMRSCFFDDAIDEHGFFTGRAWDFAPLAARNLAEGFQSTKHFMSNEWIEVSGDAARSESYILALLRRERTGVLTDVTFSARYLDRFERRSGEWRIAHRLLVSDGTRVDEVVGHEDRMDNAITGARGRADPAYAWFGPAGKDVAAGRTE